MKKIYAITFALLIVVDGYSQVMPKSEPVMTRSDGELDYTIYDWQTHAGPRNWTIVWPDGKVNFAYNYATDESFADRGTAIGTYDTNNDEWIPLDGRIESEPTLFGSIARYKENGIVVAANTTHQCGIYIVENKDHMAPNSVAAVSYLDPTLNPSCPAVMTSGADRDIIHIIATGDDNRLYYFRSRDSQTWELQNVVLPYLTEEYGSFGKHLAYWMETTDDNRLALVVNNPWSDGMVIYSYDDGETWERKVFYHHPCVNATYDNWFMYPRWASCVWGDNNELCVAYEFNGSRGEPGSDEYDPAIGGVAFWSESMPYRGEASPSYGYGFDPTNPMPPTPGQPFLMDSAYLYEDIHASSLYMDTPTHEPWPEYFGFLTDLDPFGFPYFNIIDPEELGHHGDYNCGVCAMPVLCKIPGHDHELIAVWMALDFNHNDPETDNYYFKLFVSYSCDGGNNWFYHTHITNDFLWDFTEFVYPQVAVVDDMLIIACQVDFQTGSYVHDGGVGDPMDNYYQGIAFDLHELFPDAVQEHEHGTRFTLYPNPTVGQLNIILSRDSDIVIYNLTGQKVMETEGHVGANTINISNLTSGVYFVKAGIETQKLIVK